MIEVIFYTVNTFIAEVMLICRKAIFNPQRGLFDFGHSKGWFEIEGAH